MCLLGPDWLDYSKNHISRTKKELEHSENGPWGFVGTTRRPGHFPGCYFRSFGAKKLLVPMWGLKRNPLYNREQSAASCGAAPQPIKQKTPKRL
jgi:hypothetical protein